MHKLYKYTAMSADLSLTLKRLGYKQANLASFFDIAQPTVSRKIAGKTRWTPTEARQIELLTHGAVRKEDLRPDIWGQG